jgi:hypothetical protein
VITSIPAMLLGMLVLLDLRSVIQDSARRELLATARTGQMARCGHPVHAHPDGILEEIISATLMEETLVHL